MRVPFGLPRSSRLLIGVGLWVAIGLGAGPLGSAAWSSVVRYQTPYRFADDSQSGEALANRVVLVLVDGLRLDRSRQMPSLNRLRAKGADLACASSVPSYSRPGRANLATGAPPELHGATTNRHRGTLAIDNLFRGASRAGSPVAIAGSELWGELFQPDLKDAAFFEAPVAELRGEFARVSPLMMKAETRAVDFILGQKARIGVIDLVVPDYAAHEYGARSGEYARACHEADRLIGSLAEGSDLWRTLLVVTADHGHLDEGGHGGQEPEILSIPLVLAGRGVREGVAGTARQIDVAATIAALAGLPIPGGSEGRVLREVLDLPPEFAAALAEREQRQQVAFQADFSRTLGPGAAGASIESLRAARTSAERRARLPVVVLLALLAIGLAAWPLRGGGAAVLVAAVAGALLSELLFRGLVAWQGIRLSLSAINHDEDVAPYFGRLLALGALATLTSLAIVTVIAARRAPGRTAILGLAAVSGAGLVLLLAVLPLQAAQGLFMHWTIGDIGASFAGFVSLDRLRATGLSALAVPLFAFLADRLIKPGGYGSKHPPAPFGLPPIRSAPE